MNYVELLKMAWDLIAENTAIRTRMSELETELVEAKQKLLNAELHVELLKLDGRDCRTHSFHAVNRNARCPLCDDIVRSKSKGAISLWL